MRLILIGLTLLLPINSLAGSETQLRLGVGHKQYFYENLSFGFESAAHLGSGHTELALKGFVGANLHNALFLEGGYEAEIEESEVKHKPYLQLELREERDSILFEYRVRTVAYQDIRQVKGPDPHWFYLVRNRLLLGHLQEGVTPYVAIEMFVDYSLRGVRGTVGLRDERPIGELKLFYAIDVEILNNHRTRTTHLAGVLIETGETH
jgi:hypothetical protein